MTLNWCVRGTITRDDWQLATHKEDVASKEMQRGFQAMQAQQKSQTPYPALAARMD